MSANPHVSGTGAFDVVAEFWPHLATILYRLYPDRPCLMYRLFLGTMTAEIAGTTLETVLMLWDSLWNQWTLSFRIASPILHALFSETDRRLDILSFGKKANSQS